MLEMAFGAELPLPLTEGGCTNIETDCPKPVIGRCESSVQPEFAEPHITPAHSLVKGQSDDPHPQWAEYAF